MKIIKVADYSKAIAARYPSQAKDGKTSGYDFRETILLPAIQSLENGEKLLVDFDGLFGCTTSFLDEAFGELASKIGSNKLLSILEIKAIQRPAIKDKIVMYINERKEDL